MKKIRLVFIDPELAKKYKLADSEVLLKQRPCLLVARLKYQGRFQDFAIPLRSNLNPTYNAHVR